MKKYRLSFCDTAYADYSEEKFNKLEDVSIGLKDGEIVQGKVCYLCAENLPHEIIVYVPVENFEVIENE